MLNQCRFNIQLVDMMLRPCYFNLQCPLGRSCWSTYILLPQHYVTMTIFSIHTFVHAVCWFAFIFFIATCQADMTYSSIPFLYNQLLKPPQILINQWTQYSCTLQQRFVAYKHRLQLVCMHECYQHTWHDMFAKSGMYK